MLLSLLISTASANEATPAPQADAVSLWSAPPQLSSTQDRHHVHVQNLSALGSGLALGAAAISLAAFSVPDPSFNQGLARANVVLFAVPGALLGAASLLPAIQLANAGVRWAPSLGVASIAAGVSAVFLSAQARVGTVPDQTVYLAAGLAWASPLLALAEVLLSTRAGWRQEDPSLRILVAPSMHGGSATMTWSF